MATADAGGALGAVREYPRATVAVVSVVGYALVIGTFAGAVPDSLFPTLTQAEVNLLSSTVAAVLTAAIA